MHGILYYIVVLFVVCAAIAMAPAATFRNANDAHTTMNGCEMAFALWFHIHYILYSCTSTHTRECMHIALHGIAHGRWVRGLKVHGYFTLSLVSSLNGRAIKRALAHDRTAIKRGFNIIFLFYLLFQWKVNDKENMIMSFDVGEKNAVCVYLCNMGIYCIRHSTQRGIECMAALLHFTNLHICAKRRRICTTNEFGRNVLMASVCVWCVRECRAEKKAARCDGSTLRFHAVCARPKITTRHSFMKRRTADTRTSFR